MRIINRYFPGVILFALAITVTAQQQQTNAAMQAESPLETVTITTNLVVLRVAVSDQQGRATVNLKQDALKIFEDGVEQEVSFFSAEESPGSWALVLDRSGSMMDMMSDVYDAAA